MFIGKRKNGIYFIEFFDPAEGKLKRISTGTRSKKLALQFQRKLKEDLLSEKSEESLGLSSFKNEYIVFSQSMHSQSYVQSIQLSFRQIELFLKKDLPLNEITPRLAQEFITTITRRADQAAKMYLRTLKAAFNRAKDWEYIENNPFAKIKVGRQKRAHPLFITEDDLSKLVHCTKDINLKDLFTTTFYTGMRLSEIVNLKWTSINLTEKIIHLNNNSEFSTKNKKDRLIPLNKKIYSLLKMHQEEEGSNNIESPVFIGPKGVKYQTDCVSKCFKKAVRKANLDERIHFHTLRHSFASNLVQKGASLYVVKELLGHEDITTTQIYSHLRRENLFEAIQLL